MREDEMNEENKQLEELRKDYVECYMWKDKPNAFYAEHTHAFETKVIVLKGSMRAIIDGEAKVLTEGDILVIDSGQVHEVSIGQTGCTYLVCEGRRKKR